MTRRPQHTNELVAIQVRARDEAFEPLDNVSVAVEVDMPDGTTSQLTVVAAATESGLFEAAYVPRRSGGFVARAVVTDPNGAELGQAQAGWAVDLDAREFQSVAANRKLLEQIARQTGGRMVELDELWDFARSLPHENVPITEVWTLALWDLPGIAPLLLLFVLSCFIGEWALRRWKGMA